MCRSTCCGTTSETTDGKFGWDTRCLNIDFAWHLVSRLPSVSNEAPVSSRRLRNSRGADRTLSAPRRAVSAANNRAATVRTTAFWWLIYHISMVGYQQLYIYHLDVKKYANCTYFCTYVDAIDSLVLWEFLVLCSRSRSLPSLWSNCRSPH